jgi:predicted enzyme related to lactoylglutathione lyase
MAPRISTVIHPVKDVTTAKAIYGTLLGAEPIMDQPYYVGYRVGDLDFGLDPNGHAKGMTGPVGYWEVDDLDGHLQRLVDAGATVRQPVTDVGGGRRIATVADADGNVFGLTQSP